MFKRMFDKITDKMVEKYLESNSQKFEEAYEERLQHALRETILIRTRYMPVSHIDDYFVRQVRIILNQIVTERAVEIDKVIKEGLAQTMIYEEVGAVMKCRVGKIVEEAYREKISEVVKEMLNKIKSK